ncbi:MAG: response regulator [Desulfamplus sp.]|nr:response regulator [Desulfamplus sp.]MBF0241596.1 response regulator [Desulfamplus sp.]
MEQFNVLLVDDEEDFLSTLSKRLKKRQLNILTASNGQEALNIIKDSPVDVVVLDMKMPGINGLDTLKEIKLINRLIEVIMLTGHANIEVAVKGMELGAYDYLMKPMNIDDLYYKMQDAYANKVIQEKKIKI